MRPRLFLAVLLVVANVLAIGAPAYARQGAQKVWSGNEVNDGDHRAVALVLAARAGDKVDVCSATLVSPRHLLTAAHCVADTPGQPLDVALGGTDIAEPFDEVYSTRLHAVHDGWDPRTQRFDVAIIELPAPSGIQPVTMAKAGANEFRAAGTRVSIVGWGSVDGTARGTGVLREGVTTIRAPRECTAVYGNFDPESMVCADGRNADACKGDSGGPLLTRGKDPLLVGVTSFGAACDASSVGAYSAVHAVQPWIETTVAQGLQAFPTRVSLKASATSVARGRAVTLTAKLMRRADDAPLGRQAVELQHRDAGAAEWETIDKAHTAQDGAVKFEHVPARDVEYRVRHDGTPATRKDDSGIVAVKIKA